MSQPTAVVTVISWMDAYVPPPAQLPVDAAANSGGGVIYGGSFVGENASTGYMRVLQTGGGDVFQGVALRTADNSGTGSPLGISTNIGDGTAGSITCPVQQEGFFYWSGTITGLAGAVGDIDTVVYAIDGQTLTTTSTNNYQVGVIVGFENGKWLIKLAAKNPRLAYQN